jgi:hypothetical protein
MPGRRPESRRWFAGAQNRANIERAAFLRPTRGATLPWGEPARGGRFVLQPSFSGWLVCGLSWVDWPPRAGYPLDGLPCGTMSPTRAGSPRAI